MLDSSQPLPGSGSAGSGSGQNSGQSSGPTIGQTIGPGEQSFAAARRAVLPADLPAVLEAACLAATGCHGHLAGGRHALHAPGVRLVDPAHPEARIEVEADLDETAMAPFGLVLSRLSHGPAEPLPATPLTATLLPAAAALAVLGLRLGLLARMLDAAHAHLEGRSSFGQKLIHQPLIKGQFAASGAMISRIRAEMAQAQAGQDHAAQSLWLEGLHDEIDRHGVQAAKLMGGHGFLQGSLNSLEYLSSLLRATLAPRQDSRAG